MNDKINRKNTILNNKALIFAGRNFKEMTRDPVIYIFCLAFLHTDCPRRCCGAFQEIHPYSIRFVHLCQFPRRKIGKSEKSTVRRPRFFV